MLLISSGCRGLHHNHHSLNNVCTVSPSGGFCVLSNRARARKSHCVTTKKCVWFGKVWVLVLITVCADSARPAVINVFKPEIVPLVSCVFHRIPKCLTCPNGHHMYIPCILCVESSGKGSGFSVSSPAHPPISRCFGDEGPGKETWACKISRSHSDSVMISQLRNVTTIISKCVCFYFSGSGLLFTLCKFQILKPNNIIANSISLCYKLEICF